MSLLTSLQVKIYIENNLWNTKSYSYRIISQFFFFRRSRPKQITENSSFTSVFKLNSFYTCSVDWYFYWNFYKYQKEITKEDLQFVKSELLFEGIISFKGKNWHCLMYAFFKIGKFPTWTFNFRVFQYKHIFWKTNLTSNHKILTGER